METATGPEVVLEHTLTGERANQAEQLQHTSCSERERERERSALLCYSRKRFSKMTCNVSSLHICSLVDSLARKIEDPLLKAETVLGMMREPAKK